METFHKKWLPIHEMGESHILFHYTTLAGLKGILENRALWCTHSCCLNDPQEILYGQQIVEDIIIDQMQKENRNDIQVFLKKLLVQTRAFHTNMLHVFLACFCESENLLSQWRGYTDNGKGYSVGINFSETTTITSDLSNLKQKRKLFLRKVIYDQNKQHELVSEYIHGSTNAAKKTFDVNDSIIHEEKSMNHAAIMAIQAANDIFDMILSFKHPAFKSEQEWRLIRVRSEDHQPKELKFRETSSGITPYISTLIFDLSEENKPSFPLHSIHFSPMLEPIRTRAAIELLVHHIASNSHPIELKAPLVQISGSGYNLR